MLRSILSRYRISWSHAIVGVLGASVFLSTGFFLAWHGYPMPALLCASVAIVFKLLAFIAIRRRP